MTSLALNHKARSQQLSSWRDAELAELFATLPMPQSADGHLNGHLFAIKGTNALPRTLASIIYRVLSTPLNPWRGKSFNRDTGSNHWGTLYGPAFGHYLIGKQTGTDGAESVWLDYNNEKNPALLRHIRGEARQLQDGQLLCRMLWQSKQSLTTVLWFTLSGTTDEH
jgi:hypothetical protein